MRHTIFFLLFLLILDPGKAQPSEDINELTYRCVGPSRGGRVTAVAGVISQPSTFYFGSTGGGVWKTDNNGISWKNISDSFFESPSIGAIRVAESDPNVIYAGTGTDGFRSNIISGKGVYKSNDAGDSWTFVGLRESGHIGALEIHPQNHNIVFVAAIGQAYNPNDQRGVFRTVDGGKNWERVLYLSDSTGFCDLEFLPSNPDIVFAAAWHAQRTPWTIKSGSQEGGIYKSINGGNDWTKLENGLPTGVVGKIDLAVCRSDSKIIYALVEAQEGAGLYRSEDQGNLFKLISTKKELLDRPFYYCNVDVDPNNSNIVYVSSTSFWKSIDGGKNWKSVHTPHGDNHDIWIHPENSDWLIQSNDGGANISLDGGKSWSTQFNQPTAELYQVEVDNQEPYWLYAGQQDNYSAIAVPSMPPYSSQAGHIAWIKNVGGCETGPAVPNPINPQIVYSNCKGRFSVFNQSTGVETQYPVGGEYMYGHNPKDLKFRFQRVSPIHVSPHDAKTIYHTSQYVHRSRDEGKHWEIISPDLTTFHPDQQVISGSPITRDVTGEEFYSTIYAIRESSIKQGVIWVGSNDGPVHLTQDGGKNWQNVTSDLIPADGRVDCVEPSPHNPAKAYVCILRYQLGDWSPYIFKTNNYGQSWQLISDGKNGIPSDFPCRVVREDPQKPGLLYAGTEFGMFISTNDGLTWTSFQQNLPVCPVTDIKVHQNDLVISTMGRSFWIIDDLSPLRQWNDITGDFHLFTPSPTYKSPLIRDRSGINNEISYPDPAALINYYIADSLDGLTIEILNRRNQILRTFSSENNQLSLKKGFHRFKWDMTHYGPWDSMKSRNQSGGPAVSPGVYTVKLSDGKNSIKQDLQILIDPRTEATQSELVEQEKIALKMVDLISEAKKLARDLKQEMNNKEKKQNDMILKSYQALVTAEGAYQQPMFIDQLKYLYNQISRNGQVIGNDIKERFTELKEQFARIKRDAVL